jgi:hypothetical protein
MLRSSDTLNSSFDGVHPTPVTIAVSARTPGSRVSKATDETGRRGGRDEGKGCKGQHTRRESETESSEHEPTGDTPF